MIRITPELISKERCQHWYGHLAKLDEMQHRFLPAAGLLDVGGAMTEIVGETRCQPNRQDEIHQQRAENFVGGHEDVRL